MEARRTDLLLPGGLDAAATVERLTALLPVVTHRAHTLEQTFWDTFDGRLHAAGLALAHTGSRIALIDAATYTVETSAERPPGDGRAFADELPPGDLRVRLAPIVGPRALTPIARVRNRLLPVHVLDDGGEIVARLQIEEAWALPDDSAEVALAPRLHAVGVAGRDSEFEQVVAVLTGELGAEPAARRLHEDAVERSGGTVGGVSSKLRVTLEPGQRADEAAVVVLRALLEIVDANLPGTLAGVDSEFLHDLRVALRRTRALQRELRRVFPPEPLRVFRHEFKELQRITGPTRDLDVQLLEFDDLVAGAGAEDGAAGANGAGGVDAADVAPLRALLERRLAAEREAMARELGDPRTRALLDNWREFLDGLVDADDGDRPDAARPIADVAAARIAKVYRQMVKMGRKIDDDSPHEALHDLRKKGKELRYLLEFFSSLYPPDVVKPMIATLKNLQDVLGRFQDREVQAAALRALGEDVATREGGATALVAMGALVQRIADDQARARAQFGERFEEFAAKPQRKLVARTFG